VKCQQIEELFSDLVEGRLTPARESAVREHLATCAACSSGLEGFREALEALQGLGRPHTTAEVREGVLAAVDAAAAEADEPREEVFRRAVLLARGAGVARRRRRAWASHAAAVLLTAAAVILFFQLSGDRDGVRGESPRLAQPEPEEVLPAEGSTASADLSLQWTGAAPRVVDERTGVERPAQLDAEGRLRLAPGEVLTSESLRLRLDESGALAVAALEPEPREVEVERVRTVEVPVEVPVEMPVEVVRVERRGPLFTLDTRPLANAVDELAASLFEAGRARELEPALARPTERRTRPRIDSGDDGPSAARRGRGASVSVRRESGLVRLETSGTLAELVPVLLSRLTDEDAEVSALVERQLGELRERALADPGVAARLVDPPEEAERPSALGRLFGRGESEARPSPAEKWSDWWRANGELLAAAESSGQF
jgi:hypothetical protein